MEKDLPEESRVLEAYLLTEEMPQQVTAFLKIADPDTRIRVIS